MDFSPSCQAYKIPISWRKTSKTQHFMNYWCFGLWKPVFLHFIRPEYLNSSRKIREHPWKKMGKRFLKNSETQEFRNFGNLSLPLFEFLKFRFPEFLLIRNVNSWKWWKVEDEECPDINFPLIKCTKAWIWTYFRSKNMNRFCAKTNQFQYFRASESLSPTNVPIPTPASDFCTRCDQ